MAERRKPRAATGANLAPIRLVMLVTVVKKGKGTFFSDFLQSMDANLQVCLVGDGTAQTYLIEFLGLKDTKRSVIFSIVREDRLDAIFAALEQKFQSVNGGMGIAFTVPLSSVIGKLSYGFMSNERWMLREE